jgi:septal ring factor EnvC (AmiA/AmiB activator)
MRTVVFGLLLVFLIKEVVAESFTKPENLGKIRADIDVTEKTVQQLTFKKNLLQNQLAKIEKRYGQTTALLRTLHAHVAQNQQALSKIQSEIFQHRQEIARQNNELSGQIRAAYAMGEKEKLKLILNQQDLGVSSRMMVYYNYLNMARLKKISLVENSVKSLAQLDKQKRIETEILEKNLLKKQAEQNSLNNIRKQRNILLAQLAKDFSSSAQQLNHLKENEYKLSNLVTSLKEDNKVLIEEKAPETGGFDPNSKTEYLNEEFSRLKGKLTWPVNGKLVQNFGSTRPGGVWDGVLIDAKEGQDIRAVAKGKVVFADWLRGYGLLIIIDHGEAYMTLYAFNQSLFRRAGELVDAGDVIAYVGKSGGRSRPGLYFGIRKQGIPVDPGVWSRK